MKARVYVSFKKGILDPQGDTILRALHSLGFSNVKDVRAGKYFEIELDSMTVESASTQLTDMCDRLLANPTIEHYHIDLDRQVS